MTATPALLSERLCQHARELDREALAALDESGLTPAVIHQVRVSSKRLRALRRLMAPFSDDKATARAERGLRDAARSLGAARDQQVMHATLNDLIARSKRDYEREALEQLLPLFPVDEEKPAAGIHDSVRAALARDLECWQALDHCPDDDTLIRKGYKRLYAHTRQLGFEAMTDGQPDAWHHFRRWEKYLLYQLEPLAPVLKNSDINLSGLDKLGKKLGKLHDIHVLTATLKQHKKTRPEAVSTVKHLLLKEDATLREACEKATRHCFRLRPKHFRKELEKALS